ncbi:MAG: hypothetical protein P8P30_01280 [Rickettsiales bacterium]|nr:hypothetical protein [Rickettsiales bacterium]
MSTRQKELREKFQQGLADSIALLQGDGAQDVSAQLNTLISSYEQPHRYYHDLEHIYTLLTPLRKTDDKKEIVEALALDGRNANQEQKFNALKFIAALGHDCVYQGTDGGLGGCGPLLAPYVKEKEMGLTPNNIL